MELPHVWYFADGDLPPVDEGHPHAAHESLMVLDPSDTDAVLSMYLYWEDRPPTLGIPPGVASERVCPSSSSYHAGSSPGPRG